MVLKRPNQIKPVYAVTELPKSFCVLDLETTGLDADTCRMIEIGCVRITEGVEVARFNAMVYQDAKEFPMTAKMVEITEHTQADVLLGISEESAVATLVAFIGDSIIVGQNVLFDYSFLYKAGERYGWALESNLLDTLTIARDRKPFPHRLNNLCEHYGVVQENWHSALYDAIATSQLILAMHAEDKDFKPERQVMSYTNIIGYRKKYGEPAWMPSWCTLKAQGSTNIKE